MNSSVVESVSRTPAETKRRSNRLNTVPDAAGCRLSICPDRCLRVIGPALRCTSVGVKTKGERLGLLVLIG